MQSARWVRFFFQGQDARAFNLNGGSGFEGQRNALDVRQGYVELGHAEEGWQIRAGRQELSVGDERLGKESGFRAWDSSTTSPRATPTRKTAGIAPLTTFPRPGFNKYGIAIRLSGALSATQPPASTFHSPGAGRATEAGVPTRWPLCGNGLYPGGDEFLVRNPQAGSAHVGDQILLSAAYAHSEQWRVYAGYGHLFPGSFLHRSGFPSALRTVYLLSSLTF